MKTADWLIITGDLAHSGMISDLQEAALFVREVESDATRAATAHSRLRLLPGNHDRYQEKGPLPGNTKSFESKFDAYWQWGQGVTFVTLSEELRIQAAFADFSLRADEAAGLHVAVGELLEGKAGEVKKLVAMLGQGCAYNELLQELEDESNARITDGWRIIWVFHFAPYPRNLRPLMRRALRLRNERALMRNARKLGITHILCGHTHAIDQYKKGETAVFCSGPSLRSNAKEQTGFFKIHLNIQDERLVTEDWQLFLRSHENLAYQQA